MKIWCGADSNLDSFRDSRNTFDHPTGMVKVLHVYSPPPTWRDLTESRKKYLAGRSTATSSTATATNAAPIQTREDHIGGRSSPLAISATINHKSENQPNTTLTATEQRRRHERRR
ncbi:hypothetical protein F2Q69_00062800 [Brassica cretica]|uniref:Uncharacterized protein n=1 Tax=Brassica cretica TaxID=69181 RepID=A0A8S9REY6_BRACR|nr:hypothetical protein F2Q69_00062800 [Brassica cretica]